MDSVLIPVFTLEQLLPFQCLPVLTPTDSLPPLSEYLCSHYTKVWHRTYPMSDIGAAQLRSVIEIIAPKSPFLCEDRSFIQYGFRACARAIRYRVFSHDVTAAILVSQNNETAVMLVSQTNPLGVELFSYANAFFCSNKFA